MGGWRFGQRLGLYLLDGNPVFQHSHDKDTGELHVSSGLFEK